MKIKGQQMGRMVSKGFTLIELVVVVAIIGLLAAIFIPTMLGTTDNAKSELMLKTTHDVAQNWMMISQKCGTTTDVANSPIMAGGAKAEDVIFGGSNYVAAAYQTCYSQAKVIPMSEVAQLVNGSWNVRGYPVSFAGGGTAKLQVAYQGVPAELVLLMAQTYTPTLSALQSSDTTSTILQYTSAGSGTFNVTTFRQVS